MEEMANTTGGNTLLHNQCFLDLTRSLAFDHNCYATQKARNGTIPGRQTNYSNELMSDKNATYMVCAMVKRHHILARSKHIQDVLSKSKKSMGTPYTR